jgi:APA family basic amino acid/polyamine antiporter
VPTEPGDSRAHDREGQRLIRGLGLLTTIALVTGNVIGSGIYVMPASLADAAGPLSLLALPLVAAAFLPLMVVYAELSRAYPISGGLQVYAQRAFGDEAGIVTSFLYWISSVVSNAAFATAFVGYAQVFFPALAAPLASFAVAQVLLWSLTAVNAAGVRAGGRGRARDDDLEDRPAPRAGGGDAVRCRSREPRPVRTEGTGAAALAISYVAWLFIGAESVTVPAEEVKDADRTIGRAGYWGFGIATAGLRARRVHALPRRSGRGHRGIGEPAGHGRPLAVIGPWGVSLVTMGALVSTAGILNGWILVAGRLPFAASRQGLAPSIFGRIHPRTGTPIVSLAFSSLFPALLLLSVFQRHVLEAYNVLALAATDTALVAIAIVCAAHLALRRREPERFTGPMGRGPIRHRARRDRRDDRRIRRTCDLYALVATLAPLPYIIWRRARGGHVTGAALERP